MALSVVIDTRTSYSTAEVVKVWRTKRLEFIKMNESNQAVKESLPQVEQNPVVLTLVSSKALGPQGGKDMKAQLEARSNALLVVAICLREDAEGRDGQDAEVKVKTGEKIEVEAEAEAKPTIVGTMCLGWGEINAQTAHHHRTARMGIRGHRLDGGLGYYTRVYISP